jgi:3-dehydroquinate dehydratase/shikimate dehydrogenase
MIIVPVTGPDTTRALGQLAASSRYADLFELRIDLLAVPDLRQLIASSRKPIIATCRPLREGGAFAGMESERLAILQSAIDGGAAMVDLELDAWGEGRAGLRASRRRIRWIASHHELERFPRRVKSLYRALRHTGADVVKFAYMADDAWQIRAAMEFLGYARTDRQRAIAIAMGEAGEASRILYRVFGGWGTFAAPEDGDQSAPGQLPASIMKKVFRSDIRTAKTRVFGLVGNPVSQSKGIYIHNPLYRKLGQDAVYCRFKISDLARFMRIVKGRVHGFSVTSPHKHAMMKYLTAVEPLARSLGAVNSVVRRGGGYYGANTDARGALDAIEQRLRVRGRVLVVIGAGGAARAIGGEAARRGAKVYVVNRTTARAQSLARALGLRWTTFDAIASLQPEIVANATSAGMWPNVHTTPLEEFPASVRLAFDAIYNPPMTRFLGDAAGRGIVTVSGVEMYAGQAVEQIRLFTGKKTGITDVKRLFLAATRTT